MAVSGDDWRKPADAYRTDTLYEACSVRFAVGRVHAAQTRGKPETGSNAARTLADNTDSDRCVAVRRTATTGDRSVPDPPAIEDRTGSPIVTGWPDNSDVFGATDSAPPPGSRPGYGSDGAEAFLRYLLSRPEQRGRAVIAR